jgi:hypothetical protein
MRRLIRPGGCMALLLAATALAEKPSPTGDSALDEILRAEADRAALTDLFRREPMVIVNLSRGPIDTRSRDEINLVTCGSWTLAEDDARAFFTLGEFIAGEEKHHMYSVYPCDYRGSLLISNRAFEFAINLGSSAYVRDTVSGSDYDFGCREPCRHLFPSGVRWSDEHR